MERILFPSASCVNLKQFTKGRLPDVIAAPWCGVGKWLYDQYALHTRARSSATITDYAGSILREHNAVATFPLGLIKGCIGGLNEG